MIQNLSFINIGINDLCGKRDELHKQILQEEEEKQKLQNDIRILTERLAKVNESLSKKMASRNEFDKTIAETESAYMKVKCGFFLASGAVCAKYMQADLVVFIHAVIYNFLYLKH